MKVVVIGGGPAGLIAAISAAQENNEVIGCLPVRCCVCGGVDRLQ